ncbi:hypothetical protein AK88_05683 [Plasmodium fragile]|uniref:Schizont-infected cell agglutination C-terminal domain-containing protein n=1 Tax=Plasmodium fragile TaxID=5857 RepID=A0A0D9QCB8_PLAFR|nr:uncharacterized protein AK88_05683 [Plasmodium fragile]KJP84685.1 hypothetical protein AK88_05683 [Plasmodium fragile]
MIRHRQPASTSGRGRPPRVHKRTIIELHLQVLNECEVTEWDNVKDDYLHIVVEEFAQEFAGDFEQDEDTNNNSLGVPNSHAALATHDSTTRAPPTDFEGIDPCPPHDPDPWRCMETIQLDQDPSPPHEDNPDPWSCMESIQLDAAQNAHSNHREANSAHDWHTDWIPWMESNKSILRQCKDQAWFHTLKAEWKQYLRAHMATNEDNGHRELGEHANIPSTEKHKLWLWKHWVAQQHRQMRMYKEEWFQHWLTNVQEAAVSHKGEVPAVETHVEVETVMGTEDTLRVRDLPESQPLHPQLYMKKSLGAKIWILILALVIEQCELERTMHDRELYVDALLHNM